MHFKDKLIEPFRLVNFKNGTNYAHDVWMKKKTKCNYLLRCENMVNPFSHDLKENLWDWHILNINKVWRYSKQYFKKAKYTKRHDLHVFSVITLCESIDSLRFHSIIHRFKCIALLSFYIPCNCFCHYCLFAVCISLKRNGFNGK